MQDVMRQHDACALGLRSVGMPALGPSVAGMQLLIGAQCRHADTGSFSRLHAVFNRLARAQWGCACKISSDEGPWGSALRSV